MAGSEIQQSVFVRVGYHDDAATVATIAAIGAAFGDIFLTPKGDAPVAAIPGLDVNCGFVDEHGEPLGDQISNAMKNATPWKNASRSSQQKMHFHETREDTKRLPRVFAPYL
jgi:hypothetical protein